MALTKISTDGVKDDAITKAKIPADQIEASELANNAVDTNAIADQAVTLDKLPHGDSNNNGKFLRANNGADPSFEDVPAGGISDVVSDTSPQLGGDLQSNGNDILIAANDRAVFGTDKLRVKHTDSNADIENTTGNIVIKNDSSSTTEQIILQAKGGEDSIKAVADGTVELYHDGTKQCETSANGLAFPSGKGIDFSATGGPTNGAGTSELLADYEEGTWTPTAHGYTGSNTTNNCFYTKIGRLVIATFRITWPSLTNSSAAEIRGLPFTARAQAVNTHGGAFSETNDSDDLHLIVQQNTTTIFILRCRASDGVQTQTISDVSGKDFRGNVIYFTDS